MIGRTRAQIAAYIVAAVLIGGCAHRPLQVTPVTRATPAGAVTDHVIIVSIDGLRPDAIGEFGAVALQRLMAEGSYTLNARTILPSRTLPSHTSMVTGELPEVHGILWNTDSTRVRGTVGIPTIFGIARANNFHTAAFFSKAKFNHLLVEGTLDHGQAPAGSRPWSTGRTLGDVEDYLVSARPNLLFVHVSAPDHAGHLMGWMSWWYARAVRSSDAAVQRLVTAADSAFGPGNYTLIVTSDHGGQGRSHGSDSPEDVTIPWIVYGQGVQKGTVVTSQVRTMDTGATALWLLGLSPETEWAGVPVREAFTPLARAQADSAHGTGTPGPRPDASMRVGGAAAVTPGLGSL
jgi:predicted AlkP superfamily pyrophosphatase or phosphodiesterase